jgi:Gpi18-like mannosyltransferase
LRSISLAEQGPPSGYRTPSTLTTLLRSTRLRPWLTLLGLCLLVKVLVVAVTLVEFGASPDPLTALGRQWDQWDAQHYLYLSTHGYSTAGDARNLIAFFPLYPALVATLAATGLPARLAALVISNIAGLVATILLYEVAVTYGDKRSAWRAAALFTVFPTAFFLLVGYTEAVFCAPAFGAVLCIRRQNWMAAGALGGLAAATRLTGLALLPLLLLEMYACRRSLKTIAAVMLAPVLLSGGFLIYLATNWLVLGNPLAFVTVQQLHWSHRLAPPWTGFTSAIHSIFWRVPWERLTVGAGEVIGGVVAYAVTGLSWIKLRPGDAAYAAAVTVMATFLPFWLSIPRYLLGLYPLFLLAGRVKSQWVQGVALALSFVGLITFSLAFSRGFWAF